MLVIDPDGKQFYLLNLIGTDFKSLSKSRTPKYGEEVSIDLITLI